MILSFPPFSYQPAGADNRKSCILTRMRRKRATEFVTSDEMTLREFYAAILLFRNENQYFFCIFDQNYSDKKVFEYVINRS